MVCLVPVAQAKKDLHGLLAGRLAHGHGLEAALQGRILFDVAAVFIQRGRAHYLDFAPGQGRLEDVRSVDAALCRARAHDGVQLVDKEDGAAALFQLVDGVFDALLEFAPVFGAGQHTAQIQGDHPLVFEQLRDIAAGDALGKALDDGALAHARVADEHGVVLGAAGEDLDDALDLLFPADHRIQFALLGQAGEILAVLIQNGGFRVARTLGHALGLGRGAAEHLAQQAEIAAQIVQDAHSHAIPLPEDGQEDVLCADVVVFEGFGLVQAQLQDLLGAGGIAEAVCELVIPMAHQGLCLGADLGLGDIQLQKCPGGRAFALTQKAQQQVFAAHVIVPHGLGAILRQGQRPAGTFSETIDEIHISVSYVCMYVCMLCL